MNGGPLSGDRLYYDVVAYARLGEHRTGTDCDALTTQWLLNQLKDAGLQALFQPFSFRRLLPTRIGLTVAGNNIQAFPEWTPKSAGPEPIRAPLVVPRAGAKNVRGKIVLLRLPSGRDEMTGFRAALRANLKQVAGDGAVAVVIITPAPSGEVFIFGDEEHGEAFALPLLAVGSRDEAVLSRAAESGEEITFLLDCIENPAGISRNVLAMHGKTSDVIVVSTPTSGWFTCGGERGPGIAIALALARWVAQRRPQTGYLFDFNSGHELMGIGARRFLAELAPKPEEVRSWLHLGANIATYDFERNSPVYRPVANPSKYRLPCSHEAMLPMLNAAFADMPQVKPAVGPGIGELTAFVAQGYRAFGVFGGRHYYFHNPGDGPQTTAPELLEPVASCLAKALETVEKNK